MTPTEAIAESCARIDGKLGEFRTCRDDMDAEMILGRYQGYMSEAEQMLRNLKDCGYVVVRPYDG